MIPQDKANHFVIGEMVSAVVFLLTLPILGAGWALVAGFVVACVAGLAKEVADQFANPFADTGTLDPWDFYWTMFGAITTASVALATLLAGSPQ